MPFDRARALARFAHLHGRSVTLQFIPIGPTARADAPEQLAEKVDEVIVAATKKERPW